MPLGLSIAAVSLGFASVPAAGVVPASHAGATPPPSVLSARTVERLRANGLRADDPRLAEHLVELARSRRRPAANTSRVRFDLTNANFPKISIFKYAGLPQQSNATLPSGMGNAVFAGLQPAPAISAIDLVFAFGVPGLAIVGTNLSDGKSYAATTVKADFAACGSHLLTPGSLSDAKDRTKLIASGFLVAKDTPASVTVTVNGVSSNPVTVNYPAYSVAGKPYAGSTTLSISDTAPFMIGDGGIGLPKNAFASSNGADRRSTNVTGAPGSGTDTIGYGINLVNGWTASATIQNVHSYLDAPSNDGSNDQFRSATIVQQPQSGRLETKIAWKYEPGESVSYDVVWHFANGIVGTRQVSTQPKQTTCSDEE